MKFRVKCRIRDIVRVRRKLRVYVVVIVRKMVRNRIGVTVMVR